MGVGGLALAAAAECAAAAWACGRAADEGRAGDGVRAVAADGLLESENENESEGEGAGWGWAFPLGLRVAPRGGGLTVSTGEAPAFLVPGEGDKRAWARP